MSHSFQWILRAVLLVLSASVDASVCQVITGWPAVIIVDLQILPFLRQKTSAQHGCWGQPCISPTSLLCLCQQLISGLFHCLQPGSWCELRILCTGPQLAQLVVLSLVSEHCPSVLVMPNQESGPFERSHCQGKMHGRLVRRTWRDFCCKSSWPGEWTLPARCCMLLEWGFHGSRPRCDVEPLWKVVAYRTWRSPEVGKPAPGPGTLEFYHTCLREFKFLEQSALDIKLIACLAISSRIMRSTARRKVTASWNCSMSMLAFGFGRSSSGSSDAAFIRSGWARPNLTHFIHSVLPSWREICMWPAGNGDDPRSCLPCLTMSDLGCRFLDQWWLSGIREGSQGPGVGGRREAGCRMVWMEVSGFPGRVLVECRVSVV